MTLYWVITVASIELSHAAACVVATIGVASVVTLMGPSSGRW